MQKKEFTTKEIAVETGLLKRTVQMYTDLDIIIPEICNPKGRGHSRIYSQNNLHQLLIIKEFINFGLSLRRIKKILSDMIDSKYVSGSITISISLEETIKKHNQRMQPTEKLGG